MKRLSPTDLLIFLAIANNLSLSKAAVELGVSPSALSHALRGIEERIGLRLINRTTRSVALTEVGQRLFERIKPAFRDIDDAIDDLNAFRGKPVGTLRINAGTQGTRLVVLPLVTEFLKVFPEVNVEVVANDAMIELVSGGFDAGVRFGERIAADMIAVPIGPRMRSVVVGAPSYFEQYAKPTTPHDLRDMPCIRQRFPSGAFNHWEFERGGIELDIEVTGPLTLGDMGLIVEAAIAGSGLAHVFEGLAKTAIASGQLIRVLDDWSPYYPGLYLYYPSRRQLPAALKAFIDFALAARTTGVA